MVENRSVPPDTVLPHVVYRDVDTAIVWLGKTFGFSEHYRYGDPTSGAQLRLGNAWIMVRQARAGEESPMKLGFGTQSLTVFVEDLETHYQRSRAAGAKFLEELHETGYGELQYAVEDLDGHHWLFSRHSRDVSPADWGAKVAQPLELAPRRPAVCYIEVPAVDVSKSAAFYEKVFAWNIRRRDTARPSFDAANLSGAFVTGRQPSSTPGLLPYVWVDDIDATLARAAAEGGVITEGVHHDDPGSTSWIAIFRDPAGNLIGLYQEGPRAQSSEDHKD